jgi:hypothetical protein
VLFTLFVVPAVYPSLMRQHVAPTVTASLLESDVDVISVGEGRAMSRKPGASGHWVVALCVGLTGCGAETLGTAAVGGASKVEEIKAGQKLQEDVRAQIGQSADLTRQRLEAAEAESATLP